MHIILSGKFFIEELNFVSKAIGNRIALPVHSGVKIEVKNGKINFTAISDELVNYSSFDYKDYDQDIIVNQEGTIVVECEKLKRIIEGIKGQNIEIIKVESNLVKIKSQFINYNINSFPQEDFPNITFIDDTSIQFNINNYILEEIIRNVSFACSEEKNRNNLSGINLIQENNKLTASATNRFRLASYKFDIISSNNFNIIVPGNIIKKQINFAKNNDDIKVNVDNRFIQLSINNRKTRISLIDDTYPNTSKILNQIVNANIKVDSNDILETIERARVITLDDSNQMIFEIYGNLMKIKAHSKSSETYTETIECKSISEEKLEFGINGNNLKDAIKGFEKSECNLELCELNCIIIKSEKKPDLVHQIALLRP